MNFFQWKQFRFFLILNVFVVKSENTLFTESQLTIDAINRVLIFLQNNPKSLTDDVIFGVLIAKTNLQWVINRLITSNTDVLKELATLMNSCNYIIAAAESNNSFILNEKFWMREAKGFKQILPDDHKSVSLPKLNSCESIKNYMMKGPPENSDFCIDELFKSNCNVSDYCWLSENAKEFHSGYKTTHRLIYLQVASELGCHKVNPRKFKALDAQKESLCKQIYEEANMLLENSFLLSVRDLFMEQVALCGYEGFENFGRSAWRREIRSWQSDVGCFGEDSALGNCLTRPPNRTKRTDSVIKNCHTHLTAVGISALAFQLRFILKQLFFLI